MVLALMKFFIPANRRAEAVAILRGMQGRLEICPDYLGSSIVEREEPYPHILYTEQWNSEEAIFKHIQSALYRRVLAVIELSTRAPMVTFYFVLATTGMELIEALRGERKHVEELSTSL